METPEAVDLDAAGLDRFLIGSPETVADRIVHLHDDLGIDCLIIYMHRPDIPQSKTLAAMERFGDDVIPRVEARIDD